MLRNDLGSRQAQIAFVALNLLLRIHGPAAASIYFRGIRTQDVFHRGLDPGIEGAAMGNHCREVHPVTEGWERLAPVFVSVVGRPIEAHPKPGCRVHHPVSPCADRLDERPGV